MNQTMIEEMSADAQYIQGQIQGVLRAHRSRMAAIKERHNEAKIRSADFDANVTAALQLAATALKR